MVPELYNIVSTNRKAIGGNASQSPTTRAGRPSTVILYIVERHLPELPEVRTVYEPTLCSGMEFSWHSVSGGG